MFVSGCPLHGCGGEKLEKSGTFFMARCRETKRRFSAGQDLKCKVDMAVRGDWRSYVPPIPKPNGQHITPPMRPAR